MKTIGIITLGSYIQV